MFLGSSCVVIPPSLLIAPKTDLDPEGKSPHTCCPPRASHAPESALTQQCHFSSWSLVSLEFSQVAYGLTYCSSHSVSNSFVLFKSIWVPHFILLSTQCGCGYFWQLQVKPVFTTTAATLRKDHMVNHPSMPTKQTGGGHRGIQGKSGKRDGLPTF